MRSIKKHVIIIIVAMLFVQVIEGSGIVAMHHAAVLQASGSDVQMNAQLAQPTSMAASQPETSAEIQVNDTFVSREVQNEVNKQISDVMNRREEERRSGEEGSVDAVDFLQEGDKDASFIVTFDADKIAQGLPLLMQQAKAQSALPYANQMFVLKEDAAMSDQAFITQIAAIPGVEFVEKNTRVDSDSLDYVPNDPSYAQQYEFERTQMSSMWDYGRGAGVKIGVLDIGFRDAYHFTAEYDANRLLPLVTFGGDSKCYNSEFQHGSWVMSVAGLAATNNGYLGASVANQATFQPYMMGSGCTSEGKMYYSQTDFIKIIEHAMKTNVQIMNLSFSGANYSESVNRAIDRATKQGMFFVASRGNRGSTQALYPACYDHVLSVGSIGANDKLSSFSSYGDCRKGNYIVNYGEGISVGRLLPDGTGTVSKMSGTSFSAPLTTGSLAVVKSAFPDLSFDEMVRALKASSIDLGARGVDAQYGHGLLQPAKLLRDMSPAPSYEGLSNVYRVYNPNSGEHLFTPNYAEVTMLRKLGWRPEGNAWRASTAKPMVKVYRLYNPNSGDHFYTADTNEFKYLLKKGWKDDKYIIPANAQGLPVYRLYNPRAKTGTHHYTLDRNEMEHLRKVGWRYEGIAFYAETL